MRECLVLIKVFLWEAMPRSPAYRALSSLPLDYMLVKSEFLCLYNRVCPIQSDCANLVDHNSGTEQLSKHLQVHNKGLAGVHTT